ncbi:hypothetical protein [Nocardioides sp. CER19]|uniref:hypothetical protein n=1 Tax=Nocardioides sp. CER19 TaxID=3038538 RepID=UPI00244A7591|nr:hypothetical protein [Nocardioides sp. CER19]MDH2415904.1 hypothetical protein [Nocardioides sp. CER19]
MNLPPPRVLAAGAAAAAVLALAGCGGTRDDAEPATTGTTTSVGASTSTTTADSSGARRSLADVLAKSMTEGKTAHITVDMSGQGSGEGDVSFAGGSQSMQLRMQVGGQKTEVRMVDGGVYVAVPGQDGKFMKMELGQAGQMLGMDPSQALEELEKSGADAQDLGNGHWRLSKDGVTTDIYVGSDGYLQKIVVSSGSAQTVTMTFSDWGRKITVQRPPAADTVPMPGQ